MRIGVPYYPEHWGAERLAEDIDLMREAGVSMVRMGEFGWAMMEPEEGRYDFQWLLQAVEAFHATGIAVILCTPTACYPPWLKEKYPDIHQRFSDGSLKHWGQRQDACLNHGGYRKAALAITEKMSSFFGNHPAVYAWQIDNELGCHDTHMCWCDHCRRAFGVWLEKKFEGNIAGLNRAWGTVFWSQSYDSFHQIEPPRDTVDCRSTAGQNPGLSLDFYRFSSDTQIDFLEEQTFLLRRNSPSPLITHNFVGGFTGIDYFRMAKNLDVVSWDNYPFFELRGEPRKPSSLNQDLNRGFKHQNVWVMEQAAGGGGWTTFHPSPEPGQMRLWAWQSAARGADFVCFFRWRTSRWGAEQYWHGILDHHGVPGRRYRELGRIGEEFGRLSAELEGTKVHADAAVLYDYNSLWALEIQPHVEGDQALDFSDLCRRWTEALDGLGITADIVSSEDDLSAYPLLIAPTLHVCTDELALKLRGYAESGGCLVAGLRTAAKTIDNAVSAEVLPGGILTGLFGIEVEEYDAFGAVPGSPVSLLDRSGKSYNAASLAEILTLQDNSEPLMYYQGRYYSGKTAVSLRAAGTGWSCYVGTVPDEPGCRFILETLLPKAGLRSASRENESLEIVARVREGQVFRFYLNHSHAPQEIALLCGGRELISGRELHDLISLEAFGVAVVKETGKEPALS